MEERLGEQETKDICEPQRSSPLSLDPRCTFPNMFARSVCLKRTKNKGVVKKEKETNGFPIKLKLFFEIIC